MDKGYSGLKYSYRDYESYIDDYWHSCSGFIVSGGFNLCITI